MKGAEKKEEKSGDHLFYRQQMEEMNLALAESESSYRSIFEHSTDAIYIQDRNGVFLDVNPAATIMYGYSREEMVGSTPEKLAAPGRCDMEKTMDSLRKAFQGKPQRFEWWGRRKNGEIFPKEVVLNRGIYFGKEVVFAMARDITARYNAIEALKESEDKYRTLTDQIPLGVYRTSPEGQFLYANPALVKMLNYNSADELLKLKVQQLYENPEERQEQLKRSQRSSGIIESIFQLKKKDGEYIWVKDNSRLIFNKDGYPVYFDGILENITQKIEYEIAVKEREANLKAIIENTLESIWSVDRNYRIRYVNEVFIEAFKTTFGVRLEKGVNIVESLPVEISDTWKEKYDMVFNNKHFVFEDRIDINGQSIYIEVSMNPIVVDGEVVGASVYGRDVTGKKLAELRLQYLSDMRKLLIDLSIGFINLPAADIEKAINNSLVKIGEFVGADRAYIFTYDILGRKGRNTACWHREGIETLIDDFREYSFDQFEEFMQIYKRGNILKINDISEVSDSRLNTLLTEYKIKSLLIIPLLVDGESFGYIGFDTVSQKHAFTEYEQQLLQVYAQTIVNVHERFNKEQQLIVEKEKAEESDRLKSAFLANMSHEIRTPMNGIIGFLDLLKEPDLSEENKNAYIEIVVQSGHRLLDTINDIIEISKIETGEQKLHLSSVDIAEMIGYYHGFFSRQTSDKGLQFSIVNNLPADIKLIQTDRNKLGSIISNLLKNAIKFTDKGFVEFGCSLQHDNIVFYVKDTGAGIPAENLDSVFERFVQGDDSMSRSREGSGLGLSIVKAYVEMLGGKIHVESCQGKGSKFILTIPYLPGGEILQDSKSKEKKKRAMVADNVKVLIAEDDYASFLFLKNSLPGEQISYIHTRTGADTIKAVSGNPDISLILMDIRMPDMSGLEAVRKIREFNKNVPVIAQTAYALPGDRETALEAGCNDYISKPINRNELENIFFRYTENKIKHADETK